LKHLRTIYPYKNESDKKYSLFITDVDKNHIQKLVPDIESKQKKYVVISPGAGDGKKRWPTENFAKLINSIQQNHGKNIIFTGDNHDSAIIRDIQKHLDTKTIDLSGDTTLTQLAYVLSQAEFAIVNDSSTMHLTSYLNIPVLALFGPTDPNKFGPWGIGSAQIRKSSDCLACQNDRNFKEHTCMQAISVEDVVREFESLFFNKEVA